MPKPLPLIAGLALAAGLAGPPAAALAQASDPPPTYSAADRAAGEAVIHRYFTAFTAQDYPTFREVFNVPYLFGGRSLRLATLEEVEQQYRGIREAVAKQDYSASRAAEIRIDPLSGASALAHTHWQRLRKDGSLLNEGAEVLMLAKVDGQWRITGVLPEDLRQFKAER